MPLLDGAAGGYMQKEYLWTFYNISDIFPHLHTIEWMLLIFTV